MSRQPCVKLQCSYDNLMSNNFPKMVVKSSLKDRLLNVFKLLESYIFFLGNNNIKHLSCVISHQYLGLI